MSSRLKKTMIVMPTYNEKENLYNIVTAVLNLGLEINILIVDDNSPDGTGEIADKLAEQHPEIRVIHRPAKSGLAEAYFQGFRYAVDNDMDYIITMDADFSHNPKYLSQMINLLETYDWVVGSRYISGGGTKNWSWNRILLSKYANLYARLVVGMPVNDCTAGFNGIKREVLQSVSLDDIHSRGYAYQIELKYKVYRKGFKIKEFPIIFTDRLHGNSKISKKIIWEAFFVVWKIRLGIK